jgi:transposase
MNPSPSHWRSSSPRDHFSRHLEAKPDLGFVSEWARELSAERGRPSIDPVVFVKLQLVMFFEGIRSERQLIETASLNLAHRWYLGYALDETLPDYSSLSRMRQRLGIAVSQRVFEKVVDLGQDAGLVWGRELYVDATKVEANAGIPSLIPRFYDAKRRRAWLSWSRMGPTPLPSNPVPSCLPASCRCTLLPRAGSQPAMRPGGCWRSGGWIHTVPCTGDTGAPATSGSAPSTPMRLSCGIGVPSVSATTTMTWSTGVGAESSSSPW